MVFLIEYGEDLWVVGMTEREKRISAFITPLGLFEWMRMPFGLKNSPQIYQRLVGNALYGVLRIPPEADTDGSDNLFKVGEQMSSRFPRSWAGGHIYMTF